MPLIVLLRGLTREKRHWDLWTKYFTSHYPQYELLSLDIPGTGEFYKEKSPLHLNEYISMLQKQLPSSLPQKIHLVGISLGGMLASAWANQYPQQFATLTLINTSYTHLSPWWQRFSPRFLPSLLLSSSNRLKKEAVILKISTNSLNGYQQNIHTWQHIAATNPISGLNSLKQLIAAATYSPPLSALNLKTQLLVSLKDRLVSPKCSYAIHQHYGYPIFFHPWAGHGMDMDDPSWVAERIAQWIQ